MKTEDSKMKYTEAAAELEQIVQDIENAEISVDELSEKVKRAAELIQFCNKKLTQTEEDVQKVLNDISPLAKS
ncbi:MAG: exodeoxyribonuclease VII small subunit [Bacteroidales bacterium]|nr:exodeoxyribonuclease VII small subunit [Bacteroidales bacterium]